MVSNLEAISNGYIKKVRLSIYSCFSVLVYRQKKQEHITSSRSINAISTNSKLERSYKQVYFVVDHKLESKHSNNRSGKRVSSSINKRVLSIH